MRPVDQAGDSYIQDTTALLRRVQRENERGPQPKGTFVFSLDVVAMYPSIPTSRGPNWVAERCLDYGMSRELVEWIKELVVIMLGGNIFVYDGNLYNQKTGTAIGMPFACAYSGIVMGKIKEDGIRKWRGRGESSRT